MFNQIQVPSLSKKDIVMQMMAVGWIETAPTCRSTLEKHFDPKINQKPSCNTSKVRQHTFHRSSWMMNWSAVSTVAVLHDDSGTSCFWLQPRDNDFVVSVVKLCSALVSAFCYSSRLFLFLICLKEENNNSHRDGKM